MCSTRRLRIPQRTLMALGEDVGITVAVGPHGSATPGPALRKLDVDVVVRGECEEVVAALANEPARRDIPGISFRDEAGEVQSIGPAATASFTDAGAAAVATRLGYPTRPPPSSL